MIVASSLAVNILCLNDDIIWRAENRVIDPLNLRQPRMKRSSRYDPSVPLFAWPKVAEYLYLKEASQLRLVGREQCESVKYAAIADEETLVVDVYKWLHCFPRAISLNMDEIIYSFTAFPFDRLHHLESFSITCNNRKWERLWLGSSGLTHTLLVTDSTFEGFNLKKLKLDGDLWVTMPVTDAFFSHLRGIKILNIAGIVLDMTAVTDAAFQYLEGVEDFNIDFNSSLTTQITANSMRPIAGVKRLTLCMRENEITDDYFASLQGVERLKICFSSKLLITDKAFSYLKGIKHFRIDYCGIQEDTVYGLQNLTTELFNYLEGFESFSICNDWETLQLNMTTDSLPEWILEKYNIFGHGNIFHGAFLKNTGNPFFLHHFGCLNCYNK